MREFNEEKMYRVLDIERPKDIVVTIDGIFAIKEYDRKGGVNTLNCHDCWYRNRKRPGAPCVDSTWCGHLHQYLVPIRLNKNTDSSFTGGVKNVVNGKAIK